jgi:UDP:flavonoid glycosyltransferase YjiC (YdhE family)
MKVLFGSWPAYGHLLPMLPLIRAVQRRGHDVVVSSGADLAGLLRRLGIAAHTSGLTLAESYARLPGETISGLPEEEQQLAAARRLFGAGAVDRARDLRPFVEEWRPDLIVHDTLELGSPTVAVQCDVPQVTHGYGPMVPGTAAFAAALGGAVTEAGLPDPVAPVFAAPYVDPCPPGLRGTEPNPWTTVLPVRPSAGESDPSSTPAELAGLPHHDTVYATLGTIMNEDPDVFRAIVDGCSLLPVNVLLTTGPGRDPEVLGPLPPSVRAAPFLPQADVLPHCSAVVSHAGAGTMLGALCHGLPQLCLPQGTDQPSNTAALMPSGAALALWPGEVTAEAVADAVDRLLREPSFRAAANGLRTEIEAMPTADDVLDAISR